MKPWLKGGLIGVLIAIILFFFYMLIYLPVGISVFGGNLPGWFYILPFLTGHMIALINLKLTGSSLLIVIFLAIYFAVGAGIETYLARRSAKK